MKIHPSSSISPEAEIAPDVEIGPFSVIQGRVRIDSKTIIEGHVSIGSRYGIVEIGKSNHFFPGSVIGGPPQDVSYKGEPTKLLIGDRNVFREFATVNIASPKGLGETLVGSDGYFMSYIHIGHDCHVGNNVIIANNSQLGGHVTVEDHVVISAICAFNQFCRVGKYSFVAAESAINKDILPFSKAQGRYAVCRATNKIGLQRRGLSPEEVNNIHRAMRIMLMGSGTVEEGLNRIEDECQMSENIKYFVDFIKNSSRGIAR